MNEEELRTFLRGSLSFRNRNISLHRVAIGKVKSQSDEKPFQHSAIVVDGTYFFLKSLPDGLTFQQDLIENVQVLETKEIGITMFEGTEITFTGNFILKRLGESDITEVLQKLFKVICDSLSSLTPFNGDDFIRRPRRIAERISRKNCSIS